MGLIDLPQPLNVKFTYNNDKNREKEAHICN